METRLVQRTSHLVMVTAYVTRKKVDDMTGGRYGIYYYYNEGYVTCVQMCTVRLRKRQLRSSSQGTELEFCAAFRLIPSSLNFCSHSLSSFFSS